MIGRVIIGAALIAAVSTLGDFVWAGLHLEHRKAYGLAHGGLLFLCIGAYLGAIEGRTGKGALSGALIGVAAAGMFYLLAPFAGYSIMFVVWVFIWLALAVLAGRSVRTSRRGSWRGTIGRGAVAMIGSGLGFYAISGIWRPFDPQGWDYATHWVSWTVAYLPAFLALLFHPQLFPLVDLTPFSRTGRNA